MTQYLNPSFSVGYGNSKKYRDNYDDIEWGNKEDTQKDKEKAKELAPITSGVKKKKQHGTKKQSKKSKKKKRTRR